MEEIKPKGNQIEVYIRPSYVRSLVSLSVAPLFKSSYRVQNVSVDVKSAKTVEDQTFSVPFSVPKCVRLARMSERFYELLCKMFAAESDLNKNEWKTILGKIFMG